MSPIRSKKVRRDLDELAVRRLVEQRWPKEISRLSEEIEVLEGMLKERRNG
jgi:hypothetical protein